MRCSRTASPTAIRPTSFEAGTPPIVQAIGLGAAIDYVNSIGRAPIRAHEKGLLSYATDRMREINSLKIIGTPRIRARSSRSR